jgi:hypothetical protein
MPIKKEGPTSCMVIPCGQNTIKVTILKRVKMSRKMTSKFPTHIRVLGILRLLNMPHKETDNYRK